MNNYTFFKSLKRLSWGQKVSLAFLVALPLMALFSNPVRVCLGANVPVTPPITPPITPPSLNHPPKITTNQLRDGKLSRNYTEFIRGYDLDSKDFLTMKIVNLPPGIKQVPCQNYSIGKTRQILCRIEGKPTKIGKYNVLVTLNDNHGGTDQKILLLKITR
jgi:hypothetical protein